MNGMNHCDRRRFLGASAVVSCAPWATAWLHASDSSIDNQYSQFFFLSQGKTGLASAEGRGLRYLNFDVPGQATWQTGGMFSDGRRLIVLSMEPRRDGPGRPFDEYYTQTPTHLWIYDLVTDSLEEICQVDRKAPFVTPALLLSDERLLVQVVKNRVGQIYSIRLDGSDAREFTKAGEGLPYGLSLSPDGKRVAFHLASPQGYQVWTSDCDGANRIRLAANEGHLYFGTQWSPDGQWVLYVDCLNRQDPGHDWADVCIGRSDGSEHRVLTQGQSMWFAATYGNLQMRGSGSNVPSWTVDGKILFPMRSADAKVPWEYRAQEQDLDHFNRSFKPDLARGGTQICLLDPDDRTIQELTPKQNGIWDFRASQSFDGKRIAFCRAETGGMPAIWVMDQNGGNERKITQGINEHGADHPRWLGSRKEIAS
jgi:Tol biopolymer transport system component